MNKLYKLHIHTISPVFIGTGKQIPAYNYLLTENGEFGYFDVEDMLGKLSDEKKKIIIEDKDLLKLRNNNATNDKLKSIIKYKLKVDKKFMDKYNEEISNKSSTNQLTVNEFINHNGVFYIPGSSVKGAIETALGIEDPKQFGNKLMIRDSGNISDKIIVSGLKMRLGQNKKTIEIKGKQRKVDDINNFYQVLGEKNEVEMELLLRDYFTEDKLNVINLINTINIYYKTKNYQYLKQLDSLIKLLENSTTKPMQNKKLELVSIKRFFESSINTIKLDENSFILNLGFGGGFWWKNVNAKKHPMWNYKESKFGGNVKHYKDGDFDKIQIPRTYRKINSNMLFGWVKCTISE